MTRHSEAIAALTAAMTSAILAAGCGDKQVPGANGGGDDDGGTTSASSGGSSGTGSSGSGTSSSGGSGGSSGGKSSSGASSGGAASSSGTASSSGSGSDATVDAPAPPPLYDGGPQKCGIQSNAVDCSLKTSTCCVSQTLVGTCVSHSSSCPSLTASFACLGEIDCAPGSVCCGVANTTQANTKCQVVSSGGSCSPATTSTTGSAQICVTSAECTMGQECIYQKCVGGSNLHLCGLHAGAPFNCTPL